MRTIENFEQLQSIIEESVLERIIRDIYCDYTSTAADTIQEIVAELDDLDLVEILMELEKHYDVSIADKVDDAFTNGNLISLFKSVNREKVLTELGI